MGAAIVAAISSGLSLISAIASSFVDGFQSIFLEGEGLSTFGEFSLVFMGVSIAIGAVTLITYLIQGRGRR